jgi:type I restriction enzyme M protein
VFWLPSAARRPWRRSAGCIFQGDINEACRQAFWKEEKPDLAASLRVEEVNHKLAAKARRMMSILARLNITTLTAEHDYLGQLYETFFRYTGGNMIGEYFTPRHITSFMADLCEVGSSDVVIDRTQLIQLPNRTHIRLLRLF